jgi:putative transposase
MGCAGTVLVHDVHDPGAGSVCPDLGAAGPFPRSRKANAIAERVVRSLRTECLDHVLILNEGHLRTVLAEYVAYYNTERPQRSLALEPPLPASRSPVPSGTVRSRPVLGGLHHVYHRAA